jgi:pheromone shutdown-related protein TraB
MSSNPENTPPEKKETDQSQSDPHLENPTDILLNSKELHKITLPKTDRIERERIVYLVGTAHISEASVELTQKVIETLKPDTVAVELCDSRFKSLDQPDRWKNTDIITVLKEGKALLLLTQIILASFQKKLGNKLKIKPGAEMMKAVETARTINAKIALVDREVRKTLKRTWRNLSFSTRIQMLSTMLAALFKDHSVTKEEIEDLKSPEKLDGLLAEFTALFPDIQKTLIDERDKFMAQKLREINGGIIVAIIGAGHIPGILKYIHEDRNISEIDSIPPKRFRSYIVSLIIPLLILAIIIIGFLKAGKMVGTSMVWSWILATGIATSLGALLALAHPLTIVITFIVSPFTALNPFLRTGWISALSEGLLKKPRVSDLENILEDISSMKGWYKNRLARIFLIMLLVNIFGLIGGIYGIKLLSEYI